MISENTLCTVYRESAWWGESLQRRKAFEKFLPVSSPPPHCTDVLSFSTLTPSFSLLIPVIPSVAHKVTVLPFWAAGLCGCVFFFLPPIYISPFLGHPFPLPQTGDHLTERRCGWFSGLLHWMLQYVWVTWCALLCCWFLKMTGHIQYKSHSVPITMHQAQLQYFIAMSTLTAEICLGKTLLWNVNSSRHFLPTATESAVRAQTSHTRSRTTIL